MVEDLRGVSLPLQATDMALQPFLGVRGRVEKTAEGSMSFTVSTEGLTQGIKLRQRMKSVFDFAAGGTHACAWFCLQQLGGCSLCAHSARWFGGVPRPKRVRSLRMRARHLKPKIKNICWRRCGRRRPSCTLLLPAFVGPGTACP